MQQGSPSKADGRQPAFPFGNIGLIPAFRKTYRPTSGDIDNPAARAPLKPPVLAAGDKRLPATDSVEYEFLTLCVQLAQHIVQQENWAFVRIL